MRQFDAIHPVHTEVRDQDVEVLLTEFFQGFLCTVGAHRLIPLHLENLATQASQHFMIVDKEDGFHAQRTFPWISLLLTPTSAVIAT